MTKHIRPIRVEGNIAFVPLTQGYEAMIDAADVHLVEGFNWCASVDGNTIYAQRSGPRPEKRTIILHRVLMGEPEGLEVDHCNGNGLDNRRANLRVATTAQNAQNRRITERNTSGFKGVHWDKRDRKWRARIVLDGERISLGLFTTPEAAHAAYCSASAKFHGEFGRTA